MNDVVALLQVGEINVQRRARRLRVRRFEPARPLHLVAPKDFRVGDDDQLGLVAEKAAGQRAEMSPKSRVQSPKSARASDVGFGLLDCGLWTVLDLPIRIPPRSPRTAGARRRCCRRRGRRSPGATSGAVGRRTRAVAPRPLAAPARARPAGERRPGFRSAEMADRGLPVMRASDRCRDSTPPLHPASSTSMVAMLLAAICSRNSLQRDEERIIRGNLLRRIPPRVQPAGPARRAGRSSRRGR